MGMSDRTTNAVGLFDATLNLRSRFIAETNAFLARYWNEPLARLPMKASNRPAAKAAGDLAPTVAVEPLVVRLMESVEVIPPPADVVDAGPFPHVVFAHVGETHGHEVEVAAVDAPVVTVVTSHELAGAPSQGHEPVAAHRPQIERRAAAAPASGSHSRR
jgi:hypothetical protein